MTDVVEAKVALRKELRALRRHLPLHVRTAEATATMAIVARLVEAVPGTEVASYLALPEELDLDAFHHARWAAGSAIWLPRVAGSHLTWHPVHDPADCPIGSYGIREPDPDRVAAATLPDQTLLLVPGVGFDSSGGRLGMGKGFYDRLLQSRRLSAVGIGFSVQEVPRIPREGHDVLLKRLILGGRLVTAAAD